MPRTIGAEFYFARPKVRGLARLTAWATPRASSDVGGRFDASARGVAHAVKRRSFDRAKYQAAASATRPRLNVAFTAPREASRARVRRGGVAGAGAFSRSPGVSPQAAPTPNILEKQVLRRDFAKPRSPADCIEPILRRSVLWQPTAGDFEPPARPCRLHRPDFGVAAPPCSLHSPRIPPHHPLAACTHPHAPPITPLSVCTRPHFSKTGPMQPASHLTSRSVE